ncbi:MAG: type VII toxin-antitoxin system HepT family RNase toxin [Pseudomonadales bacterium]
MDPVIVREKLESLRRCLTRVESKRPASMAELGSDPDLQDIIVLNLTRAVQVCVDIGTHLLSSTESPSPASMGEVFVELARMGTISDATATAMKKAIGFRNIAVHNYGVINWAIVHVISQRHLEDFRQFAREVSRMLPDAGA